MYIYKDYLCWEDVNVRNVFTTAFLKHCSHAIGGGHLNANIKRLSRNSGDSTLQWKANTTHSKTWHKHGPWLSNTLETLRHTHLLMLTTFLSEFTHQTRRVRETAHWRHCNSRTTPGSAQWACQKTNSLLILFEQPFRS